MDILDYREIHDHTLGFCDLPDWSEFVAAYEMNPTLPKNRRCFWQNRQIFEDSNHFLLGLPF